MRLNQKIKILVSVFLMALAMLVLTCCVTRGEGYTTGEYDEHGGRETLFSVPPMETTSRPVETKPSVSVTEPSSETDPPVTTPPQTEAETTPPVTTAPDEPEETVFGGFSGLY